MQRAAVAIRIDGVRDAHADDSGFAIGRLRGDGFGELGAAGIGVAQRDNVVAAGGHARQEDGGFVRFRPGAGKKTFLQRAGSNLRDFFGQGHDVLVGIERRSVLHPVDLRVDLAGDFGIAVAHRDGQDAAEEIEIFAAFQVPEVLHLGMVGDKRALVIVGHRRPEKLFVLRDDFVAACCRALGGWGGFCGRGHGCFLTISAG